MPEIVTPDEWLTARRALLAKEKELTKARDALSAARRRLPMVRVARDYAFEGPAGRAGLLELFDGRLQLIVVHFMFDPEWDDGCPSCSAGAEEDAPGLHRHLEVRDTRMVYVSRAPLAKLEDYRRRRGWDIPWYSSHGSDFNYDFHVTIDGSVAPPMYNYRSRDDWEALGKGAVVAGPEPFEMPGLSVFLRDGDAVFHTYSTFGRGQEWTGGSYAFLDLTPLGRQEDWEEPKGRSTSARRALPDFAS